MKDINDYCTFEQRNQALKMKSLEIVNKRSEDNKDCKFYKECIRHEYCGHCYDRNLFDPVSELDIAMNKIINEENND